MASCESTESCAQERMPVKKDDDVLGHSLAEFQLSKFALLQRFLKDQEDLNKRFEEYALQDGSDSNSTSSETEDMYNLKLESLKVRPQSNLNILEDLEAMSDINSDKYSVASNAHSSTDDDLDSSIREDQNFHHKHSDSSSPHGVPPIGKRSTKKKVLKKKNIRPQTVVYMKDHEEEVPTGSLTSRSVSNSKDMRVLNPYQNHALGSQTSRDSTLSSASWRRRGETRQAQLLNESMSRRQDERLLSSASGARLSQSTNSYSRPFSTNQSTRSKDFHKQGTNNENLLGLTTQGSSALIFPKKRKGSSGAGQLRESPQNAGGSPNQVPILPNINQARGKRVTLVKLPPLDSNTSGGAKMWQNPSGSPSTVVQPTESLVG